ncbi:hypothetical protein LCGC14_0491350 [marine sediment metagenome]|uniref:Uncharacterized protein n=1 Tax=marine sediment metagenome TaxID=412755 RepID=A0A0F9SPT9_9ZZZZ
MALEMKYFVLKPRGNSRYAAASRIAMNAYAHAIQDTDHELAKSLEVWAFNEQKKVLEAANDGN